MSVDQKKPVPVRAHHGESHPLEWCEFELSDMDRKSLYFWNPFPRSVHECLDSVF